MGKIQTLRGYKSLIAAVAVLAVSVGFTLFSAPPTDAVQTVPYQMNFQGRLNNSSGAPMAAGTYNMTFRIYSVSTGGTAAWSEVHSVFSGTGVTVTNGGLFSVQLGSVTSLPPAIFNSSTPLYLEVELPSPATATCSTSGCASYTEGPMTPRNPIESSPYAINSDLLDGLDSSAFALASGSTNYIQNTTSPQSANFNIAGTGTATALQTASLDTASAGALTIGGTNATTIALGKSTTNCTVTTASGNLTCAGTISTAAGGAAGVGTQQLASNLYVQSRGQNLVTNGTGLLGNNYNFSGFTFDPANVYAGGGSFKNSTYGASVTNDELIPVDPSSTYQLTLAAESTTYAAGAHAYFGVIPYDIDGNVINPYNYMKYAGSTDTTLAAPLNPGDTTVQLTNATGWSNNSSGYSRNFIWYGYTNSKGYTYPNYTYSRLSSFSYADFATNGAWAVGGISGNTITLRSAWTGPAIPAGTAIRNDTSGSSYKYPAASNVNVPATWTTYSGRIGGIDVNGVGSNNQFPYGTAYTKLIFLMNRDVAGNVTNVSDISFTNNSGVFAAPTAGTVPVIVQGASSQTADLLQLQNSSASVVSGFNSSGQLYLTSGSNTVTLTTSAQSANYTLNIPTLSGNANICTDKGNCSGTGGYIANGTSSQTANFNIAGTGAATTLQAATFDTASAGTLSIGTTNATSVLLTKNTTLSAGASLTITGGTTGTRPASPTEGMMYYDTSTHQMLVYSNGKWQSDSKGVTIVVAAGNSSQADKDGAQFVGNGTNDDVAINAAIAALPNTGGTIALMGGTYNITAAIGMTSTKSGIVITGQGSSTLLKRMWSSASSEGIFSWNSGSSNYDTIQNLQIDGNKATYTSTNNAGISAVGGCGTSHNYATITNLTINNTAGNGIDFSDHQCNPNIGITIENNIITNSGNVGVYIGGNDGGSTVQSSVSHNTITGSGSYGMQLSSSMNNFNIAYNVIASNTSSGIQGGGSNSSTSISNNINNNNIYSNGGSGINSVCTGAVLTANQIYNNTSTGITVGNSCSNVLINANVISGNIGHGISVGNTSTTFATLTNNTITNAASNPGAYPIQLQNNGGSSYLSNNIFSGYGTHGVSDGSNGSVYVDQMDGNGNITNKNFGAMTVGTSTVNGTFSLQGGMTTAQLSTPAAPTITNGGTAGTTSYSYAVTALDGTGETLASSAGSTATGNATLSATNYNTITWTEISGATSYKVYRTASSGSPATTGLVGTITATAGTTASFNDTGIAATTAVPTANTTGGIQTAGNLIVSGATTLKNTVDSTTAFQVQNAAGVAALTIATTTNTITLGSGGNTVVFTSTGLVASGTARHTKTILLPAEYTGAVLDAASDATCTSANNGTMTSGYDSTNRMNFYKWTSTQTSAQCYDVVVQVPIPSDFDGWASAPSISMQKDTNGTAAYAIKVVDSTGTTDSNYNYSSPGTLGTSWTNVATSSFGNNAGTNGTTSYVPGSYFTIKIRMSSVSGANVSLGNITLTYNSKF